MNADAVLLATLALTALVDAASVFPSVIKGDLHACVLHAFTTILSSPACQPAVVPEALPVFRRFVLSLARSTNTAATVEQLRSALSRLILILRTAQKREHETSVACERNALLAGTILVTAALPVLGGQGALLGVFVDELADCLANKMTTRVAAGLAKSLLLVPQAEEAAVHIARRLVPRLLAFLIAPSDIDETAEARRTVAQALSAFAAQVPVDRRAAALGVVVPALLQRAAVEGEGIWGETSGRLVALAQSAPDAFRGLVGGMVVRQKAFIEEVIRKGALASADGGQGRNHGTEEAKEPTIALKLDF